MEVEVEVEVVVAVGLGDCRDCDGTCTGVVGLPCD